MNKFTSLQHEFAKFHETCPEDSDCSSLSSLKMPSLPEASHENPYRFSQEVEEMDKQAEEKRNEDGSNIILQKSEEMSLNKHGILQERKASYVRRRKELNRVKERIQAVIEKLDRFIYQNAKLSVSLLSQRSIHETVPFSRRKSSEVDEIQIHTIKDVECQRSAEKKVKGICEAEKLMGGSHIEKEYNMMQNSISEYVCGSLDDKVEELDSKSCNFLLEKQIEEHVYKYYLREVIREWNENIEKQTIERKIRDDICLIVLSVAVRDAVIKGKGDETERSCLQCLKSSNEEDKIHSTINDDVCMLIFRETAEEFSKIMVGCKADSVIREHIHQIVFDETLKIFVNVANSASKERENSIQNNFIDQLQCITTESFLKEDVSMVVFKAMHKEWELELENYYLEDYIRENINQVAMVETLNDVFLLTIKVKSMVQHNVIENVLQQLGRSNLAHSLHDWNNFHNQMSTDEEGQLRLSSAFMPLLNLLLTFVEFGATICQKFEMMSVRLEKMKHCLDPVIELVGCLKSKELLYQKAFLKRSQNLQKAEIEVDLLGDQVDSLLTLLEKIYATLHRHAPTLQQYFEVFDILELIKRELTRGVVEAVRS